MPPSLHRSAEIPVRVREIVGSQGATEEINGASRGDEATSPGDQDRPAPLWPGVPRPQIVGGLVTEDLHEVAAAR